MPAFKWSELETETIDAGAVRAKAPFLRGEKIAVGQITYPAGTDVKAHTSPHERIVSIIKGKARYRVGGEERVVGPAEAILVRASTESAFQVLEDLEVVIFEESLPADAPRQDVTAPSAFFKWEDMKSDFITPKYSSGKGPVISGERLEIAYMFYPGGTAAKPHQHPNEQIQVCLRGKIRCVIGGQEAIVEPGGGMYMPSNIEHGVEILEDYVTINGKDIVPGFSVYHARWEK